jgi:hypothetical protein
MRTRMKQAAMLAAMALAMVIGRARGGAVDPKYIPPDAKWVVHVDLDAVVRSKLLAMLDVDLKLTGDGKHFMVGMRPHGMSDTDVKKLAAIQDALGMKFPDDLHGATLIGRTFDPNDAVLLVNAKVDKDRLVGMAKLKAACTSRMYSNIEIVTWKKDKDEKDEDAVSGAFVAEDMIVVARSAASVQHMIDVVSNKTPANSAGVLSGDSLGQGAVMVYVAADGIADLQKTIELSPVMAPVRTVRVSIGEEGDDLVLKGKLNVKTAEAARQVRGALEGVRALATLASLDDSGDKQLKALSLLAARATVTVDDTIVTINWPIVMSSIRDLTEASLPHRKLATAPATEPVPQTPPAP